MIACELLKFCTLVLNHSFQHENAKKESQGHFSASSYGEKCSLLLLIPDIGHSGACGDKFCYMETNSCGENGQISDKSLLTSSAVKQHILEHTSTVLAILRII